MRIKPRIFSQSFPILPKLTKGPNLAAPVTMETARSSTTSRLRKRFNRVNTKENPFYAQPPEDETGSDNGQKQFKPGRSISWYAKHPIDHAQTLLGERYLCRGAGMFVVAPSGMGKS